MSAQGSSSSQADKGPAAAAADTAVGRWSEGTFGRPASSSVPSVAGTTGSDKASSSAAYSGVSAEATTANTATANIINVSGQGAANPVAHGATMTSLISADNSATQKPEGGTKADEMFIGVGTSILKQLLSSGEQARDNRQDSAVPSRRAKGVGKGAAGATKH